MTLIDQMVLDTRGLAAKVAAVHGGRDPELVELRDVVEELAGSIPGFIARPSENTDEITSLLKTARRITEDYQPPAWACRTLTRFYGELAGLDRVLNDQLTAADSASVSRDR